MQFNPLHELATSHILNPLIVCGCLRAEDSSPATFKKGTGFFVCRALGYGIGSR